MIQNDTYRTIEESFEGEIFKDKASKFLGYSFPISNEAQVKPFLDGLKTKHYKARHWCYAWKVGALNPVFRANDDGEPNNSAGQPILGQLTAFDVTNILVVVVRYFGGTKLGVGGLINAYRTSAKFALENSLILEKTVNVIFELTFEYEFLDKVMRIVKERNLKIERQEMEMKCIFKISVRQKDSEIVLNIFENLRCLKIKKVN